MKMTLRTLSALLGYPSAELKEHAGDLRQAVRDEALLGERERARLEPLLGSLETEDLLDLQAGYSELFDRSRSLSLHLFEHVHGDSRERGQAMIDLGQQYIASGFFLEASELPDFVPVFLEYVSCLPAGEARETLGQPAHGQRLRYGPAGRKREKPSHQSGSTDHRCCTTWTINVSERLRVNDR